MDNMTPDEHTGFTYSSMKTLLALYGKSNKEIAKDVIQFSQEMIMLNEDNTEVLITRSKLEFYGYYSDYDWVVFCWLFGLMKDLPHGFPMFMYDVQQQIKDFKIDKTELLKKIPQENCHNSLADAKWIKETAQWIQNNYHEKRRD